MTNEQPTALALVLADELDATHPALWPYGQEAADEMRRLHAHNTELENSLIKKSTAIQKLWRERDDLRQRQVADEALLRQALAALDWIVTGRGHNTIETAHAAIKERLK